MSATDYLCWGLVAHVVADWFLQNDWMAKHKGVLRYSPAGYLHGLAHLVCLLFVFPVYAAFCLAVLHVWIDTRTPMEKLQKLCGMAKKGNPFRGQVIMWQDQMAHVLCIALAAKIATL